MLIIIIIIIKNEKIRVTLCENAAGALYIVNKMHVEQDVWRVGTRLERWLVNRHVHRVDSTQQMNPLSQNV